MTVVAPLTRWIATPRNTFHSGWDKLLPVEPAGAGVELRALDGLRQSSRAAAAIDTRVWAMAEQRTASSSNAGWKPSSRAGSVRHTGMPVYKQGRNWRVVAARTARVELVAVAWTGRAGRP